MRKLILFFPILFTLFSCGGEKPQHSESNVLYEKVMEIHDQVMPKMRDIRQLSKELKKVIGNEDNIEIQKSLTDLDAAQDAMMDWMAQFKMPKNASFEDEIIFLTGQLSSVNAMKDQLLSAIAQAEKLVANN